MKKLFLLILVVIFAFFFISCSDETFGKNAEASAAVTVAYNEIKVANVSELVDALNNLSESTKIILTGEEYYFADEEGEVITTDVSYNNEKGWILPITVNNVALVADEGVNPVIYAPAFEKTNSWDTKDLVLIAGENVLLDGITFGDSDGYPVSVDVISSNVTISNCTFLGSYSGLYVRSTSNDINEVKYVVNTTIDKCTFEGELSYLYIINGVSKPTITNNTFKTLSDMDLFEEISWGPLGIELDEAIIENNTFEEGSSLYFGAANIEEDFKNYKEIAAKCGFSEEPIEIYYDQADSTIKVGVLYAK